MKNIFKKLIYQFSKSKVIYLFSKKIVDYYKNENNCDFETNGEGHFIEKNGNNFKNVFDIGANVGDWTNYVSNRLPECKIYSFEPSKNTFEILSNNINNKNISIFNIGLGNKKEIKTFYNYDNNSTLNSSIDRKTKFKNKTEEQAIFDTLDDFCKENNIENISFLKIDVEGSELEVLKGSKNFISRGKINYIQFEYGGTYIDAGILLKDVFSFFEDKPYKIYKIMQNKIEKIDEYNQNLENFQYSNYLAICTQNDNN